ncbi:MAG TPA: DUF4399 domain-containing protein [Xanthobacteraceae bacterium]|nr:DUF4399 domain-containing protein [Xanthobacteraceae bacterium]
MRPRRTRRCRVFCRTCFCRTCGRAGVGAIGARSDAVTERNLFDQFERRPGSRKPMITLLPGQHKLQLVLGGWSHIARTPPVMSNVITVTVR